MSGSSEECPWCGSVISRERFLAVEQAIREDEQRKLAGLEQELRRQLEAEVLAKLAVREEQLAADRASLTSAQAALAEERLTVAESAKQQVELTTLRVREEHQQELAELREVLAKDKDAALLLKDADYAREREALKKTILDLNRRVEEQEAAGVGEGAEIDLYDRLRAEFPDDQITALATGKASGSILHTVQYKGDSCGTILIDAKRRQAWNGTTVKKLRQDQTDAGASHAILATCVFPAGKKELFIDGGIIVVSPARAVIIIELLRKFLIGVHAAKLGVTERSTKLARLYEFMTSADFTQKLSEAEKLLGDALQIDVDEKRAHDHIWKKRGTLLTRMKHVLREIDTDVTAIVEARETTPIAAMTIRAVTERS